MTATLPSLETFVRIAGVGQLVLVAASTVIPRVLHWRQELSRLTPLLRRLFWVYAAYILAMNLAFGLLSALAPQWLLDGSPLAAVVCAVIALYWGARLAIQFACFGGVEKPVGLKFRLAEWALVGLFVLLTLTYTAAFLSMVEHAGVNAFLPHDALAFSIGTAIVLGALLAAFAIARLGTARPVLLLAWMVPAAAVICMELFLAGQPAGFRMLVIILGVLFGMKGVVSIESLRAGEVRLNSLAWFIFAAGWPGMRPSAFADVPGARRKDAGSYLGRGVAALLAGFVVTGAARLVSVSYDTVSNEMARLILSLMLLLPGLSLILHFGIFTIPAGCWRLVGADCRPLFRDPLRSKSLTEFWGRRWNLAFSEMSAITVFRPLRPRIGKGPAVFATFLFSGLLHELAISLPVHAGYGLPMLYFVLHGAAVAWEVHLAKQGRAIEFRPWFGRIWCIAWLVLPLPMLFHPAFLNRIIFPLIGG